MSVEVIEDAHWSGNRAVMICTTSMHAFGPVFEGRKEAESFLRWLEPHDPREFSGGTLANKVSDFRKEVENQVWDV